MTTQKSILLLIISVMILAVSCKDDPCESVVCQNDGTCVDGVCDCLPGFEGEFCELITRQKITGNFVMTYNCEGDTAETDIWGIAADAMTDNEVIIMELHKRQLWVRATITDPNSIELNEVIAGAAGYTISGSGTIEDEDQLSFDYTLIRDFPPDTAICSVEALRL